MVRRKAIPGDRQATHIGDVSMYPAILLCGKIATVRANLTGKQKTLSEFVKSDILRAINSL
jgi:hypothetical protein